MDATEITIALITAITTGAVGFVLGGQKARLDYRQALALEIWKERNRLYQQVLQLMQLLPLYPDRLGEVTYNDLLNTSEKFQTWYFEGAGLFLANTSRTAYLNMQKEINARINKAQKLELPLSEKDYADLQQLMSDVRVELAQDLLSRRRALM